MLSKPTLFVVGAGASAEFSFPVGSELASNISRSLDIRFSDGFTMDGRGDRQIWELLSRKAQSDQKNANEYLRACWRIRDGIQLSYSIDNFLDKHADDEDIQLCGRMAIVKCILHAEEKSKLFYKSDNLYNTINFQSVSATWLASLFKILQDRVRLGEIYNFFENCKIVTFNYDRCIEHFFFHALKVNYGVSDAIAAEALRKLDIVHVYGRVGALPWETPVRPGGTVSFGESGAPIHELWKGIRTYADEFDDDAKTSKMMEMIRSSQQIFFLGFSYQETNLNLFGNWEYIPSTDVFGSAYNISAYNKSAIERSLQNRFGPQTRYELSPITCDAMINDYARALM